MREHWVHDPDTGRRAVIVIHSVERGPAFGGIRRRRYADEAAGLADARRLAAAMTAKCALAQLPAGGAKTVVFEPACAPGAGGASEGIYRALGRAVDALGGEYVCGPDVGTGDAELAWVRAETRHVNPIGNDAAASTARGVLAGLRATCAHRFGDRRFAGRHFLVQGLGAVGAAVAAGLLDAGASVSGYDLNAAARSRAEAMGVASLEGDAVLSTPCDVFVPCALGGVVDARVAETLPAAAVCGSANNVLADDASAELLRARGVLLAPDVLVSAGAVIEGVLTVLRARGNASGDPEVGAWIDRTEQRCLHLFAEADAAGHSPHAAALASLA